MKKIIKSGNDRGDTCELRDMQILRQLELSQLEAECYVTLWDDPTGMYAIDLAVILTRSASNLYSALRKLEEYGFVISFKITSYDKTFFKAVALEEAFEVYMARKRAQLLPLMQRQRRQRPLG